MVAPALLSSQSIEWSTPPHLFEALDARYHFTVDVCASRENAKCARYFTQADDGLAQSWLGEQCWCNPPYGRGIGAWLAKSVQSVAQDPRTRVVMLVPARTDTRWWQQYAMQAISIIFLPGRLTFGGADNPAPFPSVLLEFSVNRVPQLKRWTE